MKTQLLALGLLLTASACTSPKYTILTVPAVSMTRPSMEAGKTATRGDKVSSRYCQGDDPITSTDQNVGLIDEAIMKAQKDSGAEYLSDVVISRQENCIVVDAVAMK